MATESASWALSLDDGISAPSESAAQALEKLDAKIKRETKALGEMKRAMKQLQGGTVVNVDAFRELQAKIDKTQQSIATSRSAYLSLGGDFRRVRREVPTSALNKLSQAAGQVPGPLGGIVGKLESMKATLAGAGLALGAVALASALVALGVAAAGAAAALASYALQAANASRSELLRLEALTRIRRRFLGGELGGDASAMQHAMDRVSEATDLGRGKLEEYARVLHRRGLRGSNFEQALEAMAIQGSVLGDRYAMSFANMAAGAARFGTSVKALADDVRTRLGDLAARKALALDVQIRRLRENFDKLFGDVKIEGFLRLFKAFADTFSLATSRGRALKAMMERLFTPIFGGAESAAGVVRDFFEGLVIGALLIEGKLLDLEYAFIQTFGVPRVFQNMERMRIGMYLGVAVVGALAGSLLAVGAALAILALPLAAVGALGFALGAGLAMIATELGHAREGISDFLAQDWSRLGTDLVQGMAAGIRAGFSQVWNSVRDLGRGAVQTLRDTLGIRSPSKVFAGLGLEVAAGMTLGVDRGAPEVDAAVSELVSVPDVALTAAAAAGGGATSHASIVVGDIVFQVGEGQDGESIGAAVRSELEGFFEDLVTQLGGALA